jgi:ribonuclease D
MKYLQGIEHLHTLFNATTVAFDCETTGLQPVYGGLRLLQLAALDRMPVVIDCWDLEDHHWQDLEEFFLHQALLVSPQRCFRSGLAAGA